MIRGVVLLLFLLGPWYRYLRPLLLEIEEFKYAPFALEVLIALLVVAGLLVRGGLLELTGLDRSMLAYGAAVAVSAAWTAVSAGAPAALNVVKVYGLAVPVYWAVRFFVRDRTPALLRWYLVFVGATVVGLVWEHVLYNVAKYDPLDVLLTKYYAHQPDFNPREYSFLLNPESYYLPLFGNVIRPFGALGGGPITGVLYASAFAWVLFAERGPARPILLSVTAVAAFLTVSRSAYVIILVVVLIYLWQRVPRVASPTGRVLAGYGTAAVLVGGAGLAYPAVAALLTAERIAGPAGLLASKVLLKDAYVFAGDMWASLASGRLLPVAFGGGRIEVESAFDEVGRLRVDYFLTHVTDVAVFGWIYDIGVVPIAVLAVVLWRSLGCVRALRARGCASAVELAWPAQVLIICLANWHYSSLFKYSLDVFYMACLGLISHRLAEATAEARVASRAISVDEPVRPQV